MINRNRTALINHILRSVHILVDRKLVDSFVVEITRDAMTHSMEGVDQETVDALVAAFESPAGERYFEAMENVASIEEAEAARIEFEAGFQDALASFKRQTEAHLSKDIERTKADLQRVIDRMADLEDLFDEVRTPEPANGYVN